MPEPLSLDTLTAVAELHIHDGELIIQFKELPRIQAPREQVASAFHALADEISRRSTLINQEDRTP